MPQGWPGTGVVPGHRRAAGAAAPRGGARAMCSREIPSPEGDCRGRVWSGVGGPASRTRRGRRAPCRARTGAARRRAGRAARARDPVAGDAAARGRARDLAGHGEGGVRPARRRGLSDRAAGVRAPGRLAALRRPRTRRRRRTRACAPFRSAARQPGRRHVPGGGLAAGAAPGHRGAPSLAYDYGDPRGRIELRTALSGYLGRARGVIAPPERIVVTSGYVQGLALLTRVLDGGAIAMEDPGLPFHRDVVRHDGGTRGAAAGRRTGRPRRGLERRGGRRRHARAPVPDRGDAAPGAAAALTDWARARGGLIVEDDYDGEFRYDRQPVGALQGMAPEQVVYLGTASKTLGPALRLGWMVLPPHLVDAVADAKLHSDHHTESIGQLALAELITSHAYDRHVRACRLRYRRRRDQLLDRLGARGGVRGDRGRTARAGRGDGRGGGAGAGRGGGARGGAPGGALAHAGRRAAAGARRGVRDASGAGVSGRRWRCWGGCWRGPEGRSEAGPAWNWATKVRDHWACLWVHRAS